MGKGKLSISDLKVLANEYWIFLGAKIPKRNTAYHYFIDFIKDKNPRFSLLRSITWWIKNIFKKNK